MTEDAAPANDAQDRNWNGTGGKYWAAHADRYDRGVAGYQQALLDAATPSNRTSAREPGTTCVP